VKYFFDQTRANVGIFFSRHHENSFQPGLQTTVHQSHLQLVLIIGYRANTPDDGVGVSLSRVLDHQSGEAFHRHPAVTAIDVL